MAKNITARLSDGTTITVRTVRELVQTRYVEAPSRKRPANAEIVRLDGPLYLAMNRPGAQLVPIRHPDYDYASTDAEGARKALAFFVDSAEACIAHAASEGIPVEDCY